VISRFFVVGLILIPFPGMLIVQPSRRKKSFSLPVGVDPFELEVQKHACPGLEANVFIV